MILLVVAMIGSGSVGFTKRLVQDILAVPEFRDTVFHFMDIDAERLQISVEICRRLIDRHHLPARVLAFSDQREALKGAKYVICTIRVGGLDAFVKDIEIPLKYGVDQCVGDTLGPGGIFYALRTIPVLLNLAADMASICPDALLLNYTNPMAMVTWALNRQGAVRVLGLCHGVQRSAVDIAKALSIPIQELDYICAGINHQAWFIKVNHRGRDMIPHMLEAFTANSEFAAREPCRIDVLRRFGYFSTESNGHLTEYLPWYRRNEAEKSRWIYTGDWIGGETGGYLRYCRETRYYYRENQLDGAQIQVNQAKLGERTEEHASYIIEALELGRRYRGCFNVENTGIITNLPLHCTVEVPCDVDYNGIYPLHIGDLPAQCAAVCRASVSVQELAVEAALTGNKELVRQAMLLDPLTGAVCTTDDVWRMSEEMLAAYPGMLPQFRC